MLIIRTLIMIINCVLTSEKCAEVGLCTDYVLKVLRR
jgi:hypothetical protein